MAHDRAIDWWRPATKFSPQRLGKHAGLVMLLSAISTGASAGSMTVNVSGIRNSDGTVLIAVCDSANFLKAACPYGRSLAAAAGNMSVIFDDVAPGQYAVQLFHDENANGKLDMDKLGIPIEGIGFSNNAKGNYGPPTFESAAFDMGTGDKTIQIQIGY